MNNKVIPIKFGLRWIIFFILLETSTVPMVAMSNSYVIQSIWYMSIMGFIVAFICVLFIVKFLKKLIIKHSDTLFGIEIDNISGLWYIGVIAGILLMVMFFVQDLLFTKLHWGDFSTGFVSAFISVAVALSFYQIIVWSSNFAISLYSEQIQYQLTFVLRDIFILAFMFGLYEFIVCPITGLWIPYPAHRLSLAILSGILGGGSGGLLLYLWGRFVPIHPNLTLLAKE